MRTNEDKPGRVYWDAAWSGRMPEGVLDPRDRRLDNEVNRRFDGWFRRVLAGVSGRLIEVGCAGSAWLPYFAREHGFSVTGLDYSPRGCEQAEAALTAAGVPGNVVCADLFAPPARQVGRFDVVFSFGMVEHFSDTVACMRALAAFVAPGGRLVTVVPNMNGTTGWLQRLVDRSVYDVHVPLTPAQLTHAQAESGLQTLESRYFVAVNYGVVNGSRAPTWGTLLHRQAYRLSKLIWAAERAATALPATGLFSPYVVCVGRKH
jgi:2-polyprenyl-3-methyl-5-hydroxy-6-metoxy-1,4-benzoquinol methylase